MMIYVKVSMNHNAFILHFVILLLPSRRRGYVREVVVVVSKFVVLRFIAGTNTTLLAGHINL